ncbi:MAG TPA: PQQ-dependent sugar dehydrogenase [Vicinamibacterales bacterium]|nr:PQQ-dependent sugar dehydrogenase [Vicinamibacterales bacterium]
MARDHVWHQLQRDDDLQRYRTRRNGSARSPLDAVDFPIGPDYLLRRSFPGVAGNVFLGALSGLNLRRLELLNGRVTHQEELLLTSRPRRIRDVRQGPDGLLYVLTDAGALLRPRAVTLTFRAEPRL